jgi:MacB-like periplasmic core domain
VLTAQLSLPSARYPNVEQRMAFYQQVVARLKTLSGVASVAGTSAIPLSGMEIVAGVLIEGRPQADSVDKLPISKVEAVTVDYFRTLGILLIQGRGFTEQDNKDAPAAVIINETFARRYLPGEDPIGKRLKVGADLDDSWQSIVGIVRDIKHRTLEEEPQPEVYTPYLQTSGELFEPQHFPSTKLWIAFQRHGGAHIRHRPGADRLRALRGRRRGDLYSRWRFDSDQPTR